MGFINQLITGGHHPVGFFSMFHEIKHPTIGSLLGNPPSYTNFTKYPTYQLMAPALLPEGIHFFLGFYKSTVNQL